MPSISFPYKIYKGFACPIITFELKGHNNWIGIDAYVDSGASFTILSIQEANRLRIDYEKGKQTFITVGDGSLIPVYLHMMPVKIGNIVFKAAIGFSPRLGVGFNLIGRKDIFSYFDITFSDSKKTISFIPIN